MTVVTRFAPSPTGFLHIGGARTALYNWLFARHHAQFGDGGRFLLRIEDTDRKRSTNEAVDAILDGLTWLGLDWEGEAVSQFARRDAHAAAAERLLAAGHAYRCYCTPEELATMRERAMAEGRKSLYDGTWRDRDSADAPAGVAPTIRLKAPQDGETVIEDLVQGRVTVANAEMDDMVLLRADGTPTYMLAVVVDDHDMAISHVIRGDDHLTNAFRQIQLYNALGWSTPVFAHIPLIHGADGAKMSKRHGALGVDAYRDLGFLPEAICNYLLRLGWSHGDDEFISRDQAIEWFDIDAVNKGAARFDMAKLTNLNGHYIRNADDARLTELVMRDLHARHDGKLAVGAADRVKMGMSGLKERAKLIPELVDFAEFYALPRPLLMNDKASTLVDSEARIHIAGLYKELAGIDDWSESVVDAAVHAFAERESLKLGKIAQPLRAALTGTTTSPGIFEVMAVLGRDETLARLNDVLNDNAAGSA